MVVVLFLVLDDFECDFFLVFVVEALDGDAEAAFAEELKDLVSVGNVIFRVDAVVALGVIVAEVIVLLFASCLDHVFLGVWDGLDLSSAFTEVVDLREVENLHLLVFGQ